MWSGVQAFALTLCTYTLIHIFVLCDGESFVSRYVICCFADL